jgi:hypothetical protein
MGAYKLLVLHCTATPKGRAVTPEEILTWHTAPKDLPGGKVKYNKKVYRSRAELPNDKIGGKLIKHLRGHGWSKGGYSKMIHLDGEVTQLYPYDNDAYIDAYEMTNGALGVNSIARHFVYVGGLSAERHLIRGKMKYKAEDTRSLEQELALKELVLEEIDNNPQIEVAGHNQIDPKSCPCFNVPEWLENIGVKEANICRRPLLVNL